MKLSIVTTLYKSADHIAEFHKQMSEVARSVASKNYELIFVNDGSPDKSLAIIQEIAKKDPQIVLIDLSRNFGQHKALIVGLEYASGELVFQLDSDLEEDPTWLALFHDVLSRQSCDVVYGVQAKRRGKFRDRAIGTLFYRLFNLLTGLDMPVNVTTARLFTRRYLKALLGHKEQEIFLAGLWHITGFSQVPQAVEKKVASETTYSLRQKLSMFVTSVTSFSSAPLVGIFYLGAAILFGAFLSICYLIFNQLFGEKALAGWTSVMVSVWFLGGLIISFLGIIGIYLHKIYMETKKRPRAIIRQIYKHSTDRKSQ